MKKKLLMFLLYCSLVFTLLTLINMPIPRAYSQSPSPTPNQGNCQSYTSITLPNPALPNNCPAGTYSSAVYICQDGSNPNTGLSWCAGSAEWATLIQGYCLSHSNCPTPTPTPTITPTPPAATATPTSGPTATPTPSCQLKPHGDATCDGHIKSDDYDVWRREFLGELSTKTSDFNNDGKIDTDDFNIWRDGFLNASLPH